jgi:N-acetylglucosaminyldiphosphoundecaprenol N-acetyl-beta-D-mannosaminyltransferase
MKRIWIDGVGIDDVSMEEALERAMEMDGETKVIFTPNAVMLDAARRDPEIGALLSHASLSLADGVGAMLAARRVGETLRTRIAGIDFGEALLARAEREGLRVFLLGGKEGVAASAAAR